MKLSKEIRRSPCGKTGMKALLTAWMVLTCVGPACGQVRVVTWNVREYGFSGTLNPGTSTVLKAIGDESVNGVAKAPDILILQELDYGHDAADAIVTVLNTLYGAGTYARASQATYDYSMPVNVIYNTTTVTLEDTYYFKYSSSPRSTGRYRFGIDGYGDEADLYVYNTHYKAGTSSSDQNRRADEAWNIRVDADALPAEASIIYAGDFNQYSCFEDGYNDYAEYFENPYMWLKTGSLPPGTSGNGQAVDPINRAGVWHDSSIYRPIHTQTPGSTYTAGGMDDRFDFQMVSTDLFDGEGLSYIAPGVGDCTAATASYRAFGNSGTHNLNGDISSGTGHPDPNVLAALETASDHLPVVADYQVPAKMDVEVGTAPTCVIVDAGCQVDVTVSNAADVIAAVGADELDYELSTSGGLSGSASGTDPALGGGNTHPVSLSAASSGAKTGQLEVTSGSQAVANGTFSQQILWDVLDHAEASFDPNADQDSLTIDFGTIRQGRTASPRAFDVCNLVASPNYTAALDVEQVVAAGDTTVLSSDVEALSGIAAGSGEGFAATLDTSSAGTYGSTYTLSVSDEDLPGEADGNDLTLTLSAVVSLLGDVDTDGDQTPDTIDADDIDALVGLYGTANMFADLDDSGVVDTADKDVLVQTILNTEYGDINLDGLVNDDDYAIYAAHYGQTGGWAAGDLNGDGTVTGADYTLFAAHYGFARSEGGDSPKDVAETGHARSAEAETTHSVAKN